MIEDGGRRSGAALWRRLIARILDAAAVCSAFFVVGVSGVVWSLPELAERFDPEPWGRWFVPTLLYIVLHGVHEVVFVAVRGQTPGRDLVNIRVEDARSGDLLGPLEAAFRWLPVGGCFLVRPIWAAALGLLALGVTGGLRDGRNLLDRISGSHVVAYDADVEEGPRRRVDGDELRRQYGLRQRFLGLRR